MKFCAISALTLILFVPSVNGHAEFGACKDFGIFTSDDCSAECQRRANGKESKWNIHCGGDGKVTLCDCTYTTGYNAEVDGLPAEGIFTCTSEELAAMVTTTEETAIVNTNSTSEDEEPVMVNTTTSDEPVMVNTTTNDEPVMVNTTEVASISEDEEPVMVNTTTSDEPVLVNTTEVASISEDEEPVMVNTTEVASTSEDEEPVMVNATTSDEPVMVNTTEVDITTEVFSTSEAPVMVNTSEDEEPVIVNTTDANGGAVFGKCEDFDIFTSEDCSAECQSRASGMGSKWNIRCDVDGKVTLCECTYTTGYNAEVDGLPAEGIFTCTSDETTMVSTTEEPAMVHASDEPAMGNTSEHEEPVMINTTDANGGATFEKCKDFGIFTSDDCSAECKILANGMESKWTIHYDSDGELTLCDCTYTTGYNHEVDGLPAEGIFTCRSEEPAMGDTTEELLLDNTTEAVETVMVNASDVNGGAEMGDCEEYGISTSEDCSAECQKRSNGMGSKWRIQYNCDGKLALCDCTYTTGYNPEVDGLPAEGIFTCTSEEPVVKTTEECPDSITTFAQCEMYCKSLSSNFQVSFKGKSKDDLALCTCNYGPNLQSTYSCTRERS